MRRLLLLPLVIAAACAAAPASALAATIRYVSPSGSGTTCSAAQPCSISQAFTSQPIGLVMVLAAGTYPIDNSNLMLTPGGEVRGPPPPARAILNGGSGGLELQGGDVVRNLTITELTAGPLLLLNGSAAYDVVAENLGGSVLEYGCEVAGSGTIVDSVCTSATANGAAVEFDPVSAGTDLLLRGVTARATGAGADGLRAEPSGSITASVDARNSIFKGDSHDVTLNPMSGAALDVFSSHSNFSTLSNVSPGSTTVSDDGTDQSAAPLFVDSAGGDYRPAAGSPTIDAGDPGFAGGPTDLAGNPRILGAGIDIGAYEFVPPPPTVTTGAASGITTAAATLNGAVIPNTNPTTYWFEIGQTTAYGLATAAQSAAGGAVSQSVGQLVAGTTYHYRLVAQSASGTSVGADQTFTTAVPLLPVAVLRLTGFAQATSKAVVASFTCRANRCRVTETLTAVERIDRRTQHVVGVGAAARRRISTRTVVVGSASFSLLGGDTTTTVVKLNAAGRRLLKRFHKLPVKLSVALVGSNGTPLTAKLTIRRSR